MSKNYNCDVCYGVIEQGHVVEHWYEQDLGDERTYGISEKVESLHLCDECWPGEPDDKPGVVLRFVKEVFCL